MPKSPTPGGRSYAPVQTPRIVGSPRRLWPRGGSWFDRIFIIPHVIVGVGLIGFSLLNLVWLIAGTDVEGRVLAAEERTSTKGVVSHGVDYAYPSGAGERRDRTDVSQVYYEGLPAELRRPSRPAGEGDSVPITVRVLEAGPVHHAVALPNRWSRWSCLGMALAVTAFWNAIVSAFVYRDWILPRRRH
ncbi:MAG: hypothetical protein AVDCRST_MAG64-805 [uncultured Phycisphaerae bacterium]|uniref:DUF3592 domain-containing protein n=1 Tax=uncultured Phycisphaerae bacterium TaxID=904963 RepID=A0A6J4NBE1_9BACT|nr:MAG: hypothetical protein AVDCRST_MAG64-805 [uncultured Phycisphaerae bacterium]